MQIIVTILLFFYFNVAFAINWQCRNHDLEIACDTKQCTPAESFTAMDIHLNDITGHMNICAYTGCWEGRGKVLRERHYIIFTAHHLAFSNIITQIKTSFIIALDTHDHIAVLKGAGYAMPLSCKK